MLSSLLPQLNKSSVASNSWYNLFPAMVEHHPLLGTIINENDLYVQHRQNLRDVNYLQRFDLTHRILMVIVVIQSLMLFTGYVAILEMRTSQARHRVLYCK